MIFHRHKFDPDKWKKESSAPVRNITYDSWTGKIISRGPLGHEIVYSNTCIKCGDIAFRRFLEIESE